MEDGFKLQWNARMAENNKVILHFQIDITKTKTNKKRRFTLNNKYNRITNLNLHIINSSHDKLQNFFFSQERNEIFINRERFNIVCNFNFLEDIYNTLLRPIKSYVSPRIE